MDIEHELGQPSQQLSDCAREGAVWERQPEEIVLHVARSLALLSEMDPSYLE